MTTRRDPIGDRIVPTAETAARRRIHTDGLDLGDADLLTAFVVTVARYLDSATVTVAWGGSGRWQPVTATVDLGAPFDRARQVVMTAARAGRAPDHPRPSAPPPSFGVAPGAVAGPAPRLLRLDADGSVDYAADAYDEAGVRRFVHHLATLAAARRSACPVAELPLVTAAERDHLAPHAVVAAEASTLVDEIADRVAEAPHRVAVRAAGEAMTYAELWQRAGRLAGALPDAAVVGVWADRTVEQMVALVAVLRAGAAYVALEPSYPPARLQAIARQAGLPAVVARPEAGPSAAATTGLPVVATTATTTAATAATTGRVSSPSPPAPHDLAYVMFTSGSTGVPKGVEVEHRHVLNTLRHMQQEPGLRAGEVMLGVTTAAFDLSVPDLFLPLITGATLVLADVDSTRDAGRLAALLEEHRPALMQATPSTWRLLCESRWAGSPGLRAICGGEAYDALLARQLAHRTAGVWNFYGPTETTVWSLATALTAAEEDPLPLGRPMRGVDVYLVDSRGEPVPPGVRGEIAIAGSGVARGYRDDPGLTSASFVACRLPGASSARMYLTGDLGRIGSDGRLRFAGRRDHQVKVNGFRIELGEIETCLRSLPDVADAVATVAGGDRPGRVLAHVVARAGAPALDPDGLRAAVARALPPQSVPSAVVVLARLPLTANGKVDRAALPMPVERPTRPLAGELEHLVAQAFATVLGAPVRSADDDVFALGADSLAVGRIAVALTDQIGLDVSPGLIFRNPGVRALAAGLLGLLLGEETDLLDRVEAGGPAHE